jgi:tetratricopeptide (TPR) repeat protein
MFGKRNDLSKSQFPFSQSANEAASYEDFLSQLEELFNGEDAEAFFEAIENAPVRWQRKSEVMISKVVGLLRDGEEYHAKKILDEIERIHPKFAPLYYYKANLYIENMYLAHAVRMIHRVRALGTLDDEAEKSMSEMEAVANKMIMETAAELGVSYEQMEKASWHHEAAEEKMYNGQWQAAEQNAREAIRFIPKWSAPRNNRSYILYFMGRINEAFTEANAVLAQDPHNLHAIKNLVIFHTGLGEGDKAQEFSTRMIAPLKTMPEDAPEVDLIISVLSMVGDKETLWQLAQKYLKRDYEDLMDDSWFALGVAAIHSGHLKDAAKLLEKMEEYSDYAKSLAFEVRKAIKTGKHISLPPMYSAIGLLLPAAVLEELIEIPSKHLNDKVLPRHIQKKMDDYIQKRPFVINGLLRLLAEPSAAEIIPDLLLSFNWPEVDARLLAFALGDVGTSQQRLHILSAMAQEGREVPPSPIRFWNEEAAEWAEVDLYAQMLSDDIELNISSKAAVWAEKAQEAKDDVEKIALFRKAVEADPKSGFAVHMLGILLIKSGKREEGLKLARQAIKVDPDYMFAYANLGLMEVQEENPNIELVMEYVNKVAKASVITTQTAFIMHVALMHLAFDRKDFESARKEFEIAVDLRPDDPILEGWETRLKLVEVFSGGWLAKYQEQSRQRTYNKMLKNKLELDSSARITLNALTRDVLGAVARIWKLTAYGKKAELINNIVGRMQDIVNVQIVWNDYLDDAERSAVNWVLENNGARPLKDFTDKYGSDEEESPYWNYHKPETIIGRLGQAGIFAKGTLNGVPVVLVPLEIKNSIKTLI